MEFTVQDLIQALLPAAIPAPVGYALAAILVAFAVLSLFVAPLAGVTSWLERRVWARMQSRVGPNRVGPQGILQWLADGVKNIQKEDIIPSSADRKLFLLAPYIVFAGFLGAFVVIPFGSWLIPADLNIGILYLLAITSLAVVGILMAGWSSNNKWSLLGGMRSAAQIVSYEIPAGLSVLTVIFLSGTLSMQGIIQAQGWAPQDWFIFYNPFTLVAFFMFFTSALAEGNRTPFDIPEAESELVAGYVTEYSGMRFLFFFFAEWGNLYVIGAIATTLFLGGWQIPATILGVTMAEYPVAKGVVEFTVFFAKSYMWVLVAMWIRGTLPRVRVDQLMAMCWKYMVPIAFVCMFGTIVLLVAWPDGNPALSLATLGFTVLVVLYFMWRVVYQIMHSRPELYLKPYV
ncbi:MAG: NADH-quinone oxidoreductase subunit NuoH [Deltaproteobacteria bacterium]|nr:NADH-quinone oxidoreductase subunit NuoH [Deltaproteobacteria bacterium]